MIDLPEPAVARPRSPVAAVLGLAALVGALLCLALPALAWRRLPEVLPLHYDFAGEPDVWGSRGWIAALGGLGAGGWLALRAAIGWLARRPGDAARARAVTLLHAINAASAWLLAVQLWGTVRAAAGGEPLAAPLVAGAYLAALAAFVAVHLFTARQALRR